MPRTRRPALAAEAERRLRERLTRIGGDTKAMRKRRGWTQAELADGAGLGRMVVNRLERGVGSLDLEALERIGVALDVPVTAGFGRDPRMDVADAGHLAMQELILRIGRDHGYSGAFELPTRPAEPWRSIDVVLGSDARHRMICVECWNTIGDIGAAARSSTRKAAEVEQMAVGRWGIDARVGLAWVVRSTNRNRALLARYPEVFATRFPGSSHGWVAALSEGRELPQEPGLVWCDLNATRVYERRQSGRSDG
jgi:transcriptional regulator with XRE-family HTH domain